MAVVACIAVIGASLSGTSPAASSSTSVVGANVLSSSWLDASACATGTANVTIFDPITQGSGAVTNNDCTVKFGSSNDTAALRVRQADGRDDTMWRPPVGPLDNGFGASGIASLDVPGSTEAARAIAVDSAGRVLVAFSRTTPIELGLARFNADGSPDLPFGGGDGWVSAAVGGTIVAVPAQVVVHPDDSVSIPYSRFNSIESGLWRVSNLGVSEPSFGGGDGVVNYANIAGGIPLLGSGWIDSAGRFTGGLEWTAATDEAGAVRLMPDGSPDTSFHGDGVSTINASGGNDWTMDCVAVAIDDTFCVGAVSSGTGHLMVRFEEDGDPYLACNGTGWRSIAALGASSRLEAVTTTDDGASMIIVGQRAGDVTIRKVDASTCANVGFGERTINLGGTDNARGVVVEPDGRILVSAVSTSGTADVWVLRLLADGTDDLTFDDDGRRAYHVNGTDDSWGAVVGADGEVIVPFSSGAATVQALQLDTVAVPKYLDGGDDWNQGGGHFGACLRDAVDGAIPGAGAWNEAPGNTCTAGDGNWWNAVPIGAAGGKIAATAAPDAQGGATDPTVHLRFGFKSAAAQPAGRYLAPVVFEVTAPNA